MIVYQDKRISFSDEQYNGRANLAVYHRIQNVEREFTVWKPNNRMPRILKEKKNIRNALISLGNTFGIIISNNHSEQEKIS